MGFSYINNELCSDNVSIKEIASKVKTPFYLYSYERLVQNLKAYQEGFAEINPLICYAYKANANLSILTALTSLGAGADVLSGGELFKALKINCPPSKIVFNGNGKTREEIYTAIQSDILMINVDSSAELDLINEVSKELKKKVRIAIRINPGVDVQTHAHLQTGSQKSKFGISLTKAEEQYYRAISLPYVEPIGVHTHIGSQITAIEPFIKSMEKVVELVLSLKEKGIELKYIDMGGGLGISYYEEDEPPSIAQMAKHILSLIKRTGCQLILEPGRSIVADAGILVVKVLYVKETPLKIFVVVDGGMNNLIRPSLYHGYHKIIPLTIREDYEEIEVDVVGPICEESDFFARSRLINHIEPNEYLAILNTGAYGASMESNYCARLKAPEVMTTNNNFSVIRTRQTYEDLIQGEDISMFLRGE